MYSFGVHRTVHSNIISIVKTTSCTNVSNLFYFGMTLYMFRSVFLSIIRSSRLYSTYSNRHMSNRYCQLLASGNKFPLASSWQSCWFYYRNEILYCFVLTCLKWWRFTAETCRRVHVYA